MFFFAVEILGKNLSGNEIVSYCAINDIFNAEI